MDKIRAPSTKPATAESVVKSELCRLEIRVDSLCNANHEVHKTGSLASFIIALLIGLVAMLISHAYYLQQTNERLLRLEKIVQMDEIWTRK